jgi:5'-methylthioadenosine phosphorylase
VLAVLQQNVELAKKTIRQAIKNLCAARTCGCASALKTAIITEKSKIPKKVRRDLRPIIGKYL